MPGHVLPTRLLLCCVPWRNEAVTRESACLTAEGVRLCLVLLLVSVAQLGVGGPWGWAICIPLV